MFCPNIQKLKHDFRPSLAWHAERQSGREREREGERQRQTQTHRGQVIDSSMLKRDRDRVSADFERRFVDVDPNVATCIREATCFRGMKLGHPQQGNYSIESVWSKSRYLASPTIESHEMSPFLPGLGVSSRRAHRFWSPRELAVARVAGHRSARSQVNRSD